MCDVASLDFAIDVRKVKRPHQVFLARPYKRGEASILSLGIPALVETILDQTHHHMRTDTLLFLCETDLEGHPIR